MSTTMQMNTGYTKVLCGDQRVISLGGRQAQWLLEQRYARQITAGDAHTTGEYVVEGVLAAPDFTVDEINAVVMAQVELRDCDFCTSASTHTLACRVFEILVGPNAGAQLGGPMRPIFLCAECARVVRERSAERAVDYVVHRIITLARKTGLLRRHVSNRQANDAIRPQLRDTVAGVMNNMTGLPERER